MSLNPKHKTKSGVRKFLATIPYVLLIVFGALFFIASDQAWKAFAVLGMLLAFVSLGFFKQDSEYERMTKIEQLKKKIGFGGDYIEFYTNYEFRQSTVRSNPRITADMVNEVCLNTHPPSMVINQKEVIFFPFKFKEEIRLFALRNKIPISKRTDIWEQLCQPYLDREQKEEEVQAAKDLLMQNGVPQGEQQSIHQKIGRQLSFANAYASEWVYLGQYDVLRTLTPLTKNFYWYSMEVALRNFNKQL